MMTNDRWRDVMEHDAPLTPAEIEAGWHFCADWDGLLVGPGMGELRCCVCSWGEPEMDARMAKLRAEVEPPDDPNVVSSLWEVFAIYDKPSDFPHSYVVRRHVVTATNSVPDSLPLMVGGDLEIIRRTLEARGLHRIPRFIDDDPVIVEVWL